MGTLQLRAVDGNKDGEVCGGWESREGSSYEDTGPTGQSRKEEVRNEMGVGRAGENAWNGRGAEEFGKLNLDNQSHCRIRVKGVSHSASRDVSM